MESKLIELEDGTLIEVEVPEDQARQIASRFADKVNSTFDKIKPILKQACRPIAEVCQELNQEVHVDQAEVQISFSFEGEGNIYVTKAKAGSNLTVKLVLKPKQN
jgi:Trypsin-co-occurring domain 1